MIKCRWVNSLFPHSKSDVTTCVTLQADGSGSNLAAQKHLGYDIIYNLAIRHLLIIQVGQLAYVNSELLGCLRGVIRNRLLYKKISICFRLFHFSFLFHLYIYLNFLYIFLLETTYVTGMTIMVQGNSITFRKKIKMKVIL